MKLRARIATLATLVALPLLLSSCSETNLSGSILFVDAEGAISGFVYLDRNGNGLLDAVDERVEGLEVRLFIAETRGVAASDTTNAAGVFVLQDIPVGRVRLEADGAFFGDSLSVFDFNDAEITLRAGDTVSTVMGVTFPSFTLAEARTLPVGTKGFTEGIVLNPRDPFGDGSVHLQVAGTYLRVIGTPRTALFPGDSVRVLGRVAQEAGQAILDEGEPFLLAQQVVLPQALEFTTAAAATADEGLRDAALVRIRDADIVDTATVTGPIGRDLRMTVDDGSGPLDLILLELGGFDLSSVDPDSFSVGEATGLLVPQRTDDGSVLWRLIPRGGTDLVIDPIPFPGQVTNLTVVAATSTTITLNWTEVDDGFGNPSGYTVRFRPITTLAWTEVATGDCIAPVAGSIIGEVLSCTVDTLGPLTTYFFQVRSFRGTLGDGAQFGPWSNISGGVTGAP
jgi:Fibronectin type III domain